MPAVAGRRDALQHDVGPVRQEGGRRAGFRAPPALADQDFIDGERAHALRGLHRGAGALGNVFPGIALVVDLGGAGAGGAGAGGAIVLAGERNAITFVGIGLDRSGPRRRRQGDHGEGGCQRTGERSGGDRILRHVDFPSY